MIRRIGNILIPLVCASGALAPEMVLVEAEAFEGTPSLVTDWADIPEHARRTIQSVIPSSDRIMTVDEAKEFITARGTRGGTYDLVGLLLRGTENDLKNGEILLREILSRQITDASNPRVGIWHPQRLPVR